MPARSIATFTPAGDLLDHRGVADLLGQERLAHREARGEAQLLARRVVLGDVGGGEDGGVGADHAVGAAGPHDRDALDLLGVGAAGDQGLTERPVGDDAGVVVDAAVALGLADDREDAVGRDHPVVDQLRQLRGIGDGVDRDLADLDGGRRGGHVTGSFQFCELGSTTVPASPATARGDLVEAGDDAAPTGGLDEAADRVHLGSHRAGRRSARPRRDRATPRQSTRPSGSASGGPKRMTAFGTSVAMTSTSASVVSASRAAPRSLSITASTPCERPVGAAYDGDPAAAVGDHDETGPDQREHGRGVEDLERLG